MMALNSNAKVTACIVVAGVGSIGRTEVRGLVAVRDGLATCDCSRRGTRVAVVRTILLEAGMAIAVGIGTAVVGRASILAGTGILSYSLAAVLGCTPGFLHTAGWLFVLDRGSLDCFDCFDSLDCFDCFDSLDCLDCFDDFTR